METQKKIKNVNKGYGLAIFLPQEFKNAISTKIIELSKKSSNKERWLAISEGFELGISLKERTNERLKELEKTKKSRGKSQGRSR